ncbi:MAG: VOC family protein [Lautropia sp.]
MSVLGIDEITYGADDLPACRRFFETWGLALVREAEGELVFECLNGCRVVVAATGRDGLAPAIEPGPTLREVVWGVETEDDLDRIGAAIADVRGFIDATPASGTAAGTGAGTATDDADGWRRIGCLDPNGLALRLQVTRKRAITVECAATNSWNARTRIDRPSTFYERAHPIEVGHVVFFTDDVAAASAFYRERLGFILSDSYPGRGAFLRCAPRGGHHDLFLLQLPDGKRGLNHVAFTVRDIHEVFGGGLHVARDGWSTQLGPGRHPISSAYFWYFKCPAGGLIEYYADEDELTQAWQPREFQPGPTVFAEWAIDGGLDGHTRRQRDAKAPDQRFMTEKREADR